MGGSGPASVKPTTVPNVFKQTVEKLPNHLALGKN